MLSLAAQVIDLLSIIDAEITDLAEEEPAVNTRERTVTGIVTGIAKQLISKAEPVTPVTPAQKQDYWGNELHTEKNSDEFFSKAGRAPRVPYFGESTGSTGTSEYPCGVFNTRSNTRDAKITGITGSIEEIRGLRAAPTLLRDGRRMHRFRATAIVVPENPRTITAMMDEARWRRVVLVADGLDLIVVEPWLSTLDREVLEDLRTSAGSVIAILRDESRRREDGGAVP